MIADAVILAALERLPADPQAASVEDLHTLVAAQAELTRQAQAVVDRMRSIAGRVLSDELVTAELQEEYAQLRAVADLCELADRRLNAYTAAALGAHGITIAGLPAATTDKGAQHR